MPEEKLYIGCKIIKAYPMSRRVFDNEQGKDRDENDEDCLGYKVIYPDGYESWSPRSVFENAYRLITEGEKKLLK